MLALNLYARKSLFIRKSKLVAIQFSAEGKADTILWSHFQE